MSHPSTCVLWGLPPKRKKEQTFFEQEVNDEFEVTHKTAMNQKVAQLIKNLHASFNEDSNKIMGKGGMRKSSKGKFKFSN